MKQYREMFDSWDDVAREYAGSRYDYSNGVAIDPIEEPEHVYAYYDCECYEGDSVVAYFNKGAFYLVSGGHCSCYGLEGQWEPEEYTPETFKGMLDRLEKSSWGLGKHKQYLLELYNEAMEPKLPL